MRDTNRSRPDLSEEHALWLLQKALWPVLLTCERPMGGLLDKWVPAWNVELLDSSVIDSQDQRKNRDGPQCCFHCNCSAACLQGSVY